MGGEKGGEGGDMVYLIPFPRVALELYFKDSSVKLLSSIYLYFVVTIVVFHLTLSNLFITKDMFLSS